MTLTQEELNQKFPSDPLPDTRFMVGWYQIETREIVLVYDKISRRVVYKSNSHIQVEEATGKSLSRIRQYKHIKRFYGIENCDPPKQVNPEYYKDF
jgi:hypothetical protein